MNAQFHFVRGSVGSFARPGVPCPGALAPKRPVHLRPASSSSSSQTRGDVTSPAPSSSLSPARDQQQALASTSYSSGAAPLDRQLAVYAASGLAVALAATTALPAAASIASEEISMESFEALITAIQGLGPLGPVIFFVAVVICEMIPLFPTQPLSLAAGLLFDVSLGSALIWAGNIGAATAAFTLARGAGRRFAQQMIQSEIAEEDSKEKGLVQQKLFEVEKAIEGGGWRNQLTAVAILRMTPVVPFSASNYLLGFTPLEVAPFIGGTALGMLPWALMYTSIGAASRRLLREGANLEDIIGDMTSRAGAVSEYAVEIGGVVVAGAGLYGLSRVAPGILTRLGAFLGREGAGEKQGEGVGAAGVGTPAAPSHKSPASAAPSISQEGPMTTSSPQAAPAAQAAQSQAAEAKEKEKVCVRAGPPE